MADLLPQITAVAPGRVPTLPRIELCHGFADHRTVRAVAVGHFHGVARRGGGREAVARLDRVVRSVAPAPHAAGQGDRRVVFGSGMVAEDRPGGEIVRAADDAGDFAIVRFGCESQFPAGGFVDNDDRPGLGLAGRWNFLSQIGTGDLDDLASYAAATSSLACGELVPMPTEPSPRTTNSGFPDPRQTGGRNPDWSLTDLTQVSFPWPP